MHLLGKLTFMVNQTESLDMFGKTAISMKVILETVMKMDLGYSILVISYYVDGGLIRRE